jgi:hypothetical protein
MIFEFNPLGAIVAVSWLLCVSKESYASVLIAFLVFCSRSVPASLLLLLLLQMVAFIQSNFGTQRENSGITQKRFMMVLFGALLSIFGSALGAEFTGRLLVFLGLLLMIPNGLTTFVFARFYEGLTLKSFIGACLIPAFVAIDILLKIRPDLRGAHGALWDLGVMGLGGITLIYLGLLSFSKVRFKSLLIFWSQAWLGLALFLLASDSEIAPVAQASLSIFPVAMVSLLSIAPQMGERYYAFARAASLGMPGVIGFTALYFSYKMALGIGALPLAVVFAGYFILAVTLVIGRPRAARVQSATMRFRFWLATAVQILSGISLYWMGAGGMK